MSSAGPRPGDETSAAVLNTRRVDGARQGHQAAARLVEMTWGSGEAAMIGAVDPFHVAHATGIMVSHSCEAIEGAVIKGDEILVPTDPAPGMLRLMVARGLGLMQWQDDHAQEGIAHQRSYITSFADTLLMPYAVVARLLRDNTPAEAAGELRVPTAELLRRVNAST